MSKEKIPDGPKLPRGERYRRRAKQAEADAAALAAAFISLWGKLTDEKETFVSYSQGITRIEEIIDGKDAMIAALRADLSRTKEEAMLEVKRAQDVTDAMERAGADTLKALRKANGRIVKLEKAQRVLETIVDEAVEEGCEGLDTVRCELIQKAREALGKE
jgi:hypothetical protein